MGYTHYWRTKRELDPAKFAAVVSDFNTIFLALADAGVIIGDASGQGTPKLTGDSIEFNGLKSCGHPKNSDIVIPWPAPVAAGIGSNRSAVAGNWFAGALLNTRTCNGDCSYESFIFERVFTPYPGEKPDASGLWFSCCKTAYRPYDLAVTACLLIAKHHLGTAIRVSSDGEDKDWFDAKVICYAHLGYGMQYYMDKTLRDLAYELR